MKIALLKILFKTWSGFDVFSPVIVDFTVRCGRW